MNTASLVSASWLHQQLTHPDLVILDGSIAKIGQTGPHPLAELRIPGARFFDLNGTFSDHSTDLPHNLPGAAVFSEASQQLGINSNSQIVIYDHHGVYSSPRVWWMFRAMGHPNVAVLDGGLPAWIESGFATEAVTDVPPANGNFVAQLNPELVWDAERVLQNLQNPSATVLDARSAGRFHGTEPEPRQGLIGGHIPGSLSLPFPEVVRDGKLLPKEELAAKLDELHLGEGPLVFSCGSGVTACVIMLAAEQVIPNPKAVYDGSWAEWGMPEKEFPIET